MKSITIKGMSCQHCVMAVTRALNGIEGLTRVEVDLETGKATFEETKPVEMETIVAAVRKAGYDVA
ncbi:MAG TPA: cation transporter [Syntrophales bacterium]|nr:cation transporter [Syntrophales bacterium]HQA82173.1 cation transporter [Syntrophales bacterium]